VLALAAGLAACTSSGSSTATVNGANSTGKFAGATGTGTAVVVSSGDDPKLSDGVCNTSRDALPSAKTAVATFAATIKLTVRV
jgi:hypothetical protein